MSRRKHGQKRLSPIIAVLLSALLIVPYSNAVSFAAEPSATDPIQTESTESAGSDEGVTSPTTTDEGISNPVTTDEGIIAPSTTDEGISDPATTDDEITDPDQTTEGAILEAVPFNLGQNAQMTFKNATGDGGMDRISLTDIRNFEVILPLPSGTAIDAAEAMVPGLTWELTRTNGMHDANLFPNQYLGGALDEWACNNVKFDQIETTAAALENGSTGIKMTFSNPTKFLTGSDARAYRNLWMDYIGEYTLSCKNGGDVLGSTVVRVNPYDSYRTFAEAEQELKDLQRYVNENRADDMYMEIISLGKTVEGRDMPCVFVADSKKTLTDYQELKKRAEANPAAVLGELNAGTLQYKVPILYSNVHADENPGSDGTMFFLNNLVKSDQNGNQLSYKDLTGLNGNGETQRDADLAYRQLTRSALIYDPDGTPWSKDLGFITNKDNPTPSGKLSLNDFYNVVDQGVDVETLLNDVFFIVVPNENGDGRARNSRRNGNGFDLNRDSLFQTQPETRNMTKMIAEWNPITFLEFHGFIGEFQIEPCSPPHEPNVEYDLFAKNALLGGEAFGAAAVANNNKYNSFFMPLRDGLMVNNEPGKPVKWDYIWDDMSTNYTPQYSLLHGTVAYTIEVPAGDEASTLALAYGMAGHAKFVADHKKSLFENQLTGFQRGIDNADPNSVRDWYVDIYDTKGAEAQAFRPRTGENQNFFPEYYVIPVDPATQRDPADAYEMQSFLIRNGVKVDTLTQDTSFGGITYKAGSFVVDMHQAKRNVANGALYSGVLITGWPELYSEPVTAFDKTRGFTCDAIHTAGVFAGKLQPITEAISGSAALSEAAAYTAVILENNGTEAVRAVNDLLKNDGKVGMITEGADKGDFVVAKEDYKKISSSYVVAARGVKDVPAAKTIKKPTLYIPGLKSPNPTGAVDYNNIHSNEGYSFDRFALENQLGFSKTNDPAKADIIVGQIAPEATASTNARKEITENHKPYIGYGYSALNSAKTNILTSGALQSGGTFNVVQTNRSSDALYKVNYPTPDSLVTASKVSENDHIMYSFGGAYIAAVPSGASILIENAGETPMEGFFPQAALDKFMAPENKVQAIAYETENIDVTLFANILTQKTHQQDDYQYMTNAIYSKMLGEDFAPPKESNPDSVYQATSSAALNTYMTHLTETIGSRLMGTPNEAKAAKYIEDQFTSYGYTGVERYETPLPSNRQTTVSAVTIDGKEYYGNLYGPAFAPITSPNFADLTAQGSTLPSDLTGKVVVTTNKRMIDLAGTSGAIAVSGTASGYVSDAASKGAIAVIVYNDVLKSNGAPATMSFQSFKPVLPVIAMDGISGPLVLSGSEIKLDSAFQENTWNVVAVKKASKPVPDAILHVTAHFDSVKGSPGASDNATGATALLELARLYQGVSTGGVEIRFAAVGGEEGGLNGSKAYVAKLSEKDKAISININMDMLGTNWPDANAVSMDINNGIFNLPAALVITGSEELSWLPGTDNVRFYKYGSSDHVPFETAGVDAASMIRATDETDDIEPYDHTPYDSMAKNYDVDRLTEAANMVSKGIARAIDNHLTKQISFTVLSKGQIRIDNAADLKLLYDSLNITLQPASGGKSISLSTLSTAEFGFTIPTGTYKMEVTGTGKGTANVKGTFGKAKTLSYTTGLGTYDVVVKSSGGGGGGGGGSQTTQPGTTTPDTSKPGTTAPAPATKFGDVSAGAWYESAVKFVTDNGYFSGTGANKFEPNEKMTRGMFVTVLGKIYGKDISSSISTFSDVKSGAWYEKSVAWAAGAGIVNGLGNQTFGPDQSITREQLCVMIVNFAKAQGIDLAAKNQPAAFGDRADVSPWALNAVTACQQAGLIQGKGGNLFDPQGTATRAEVATMIQLLMQK